MKRPSTLDFIRAAAAAGIRHHASGTITQNGKKYGDYIKTDGLTPEQTQTLKSKFGNWIEIAQTRSQYAPEQKKQILILRSAGKLAPNTPTPTP